MARTPRRRAPSPRPPARRAGFTIVELMVALTLTAIVIATVYTIGGASARSFQEQQRVGQLQLGVRLALDRVRRDAERAGLHGTPDSSTERLGATPATRILGVQLTNDDTNARAALATMPGASSTPTQADSLTMIGNFDTSDAYLMRGLDATGQTIYFQTAWQGFRRSFATNTSGNTFSPELFAQVFAPGRLLHITTLANNHFFVTVQSSGITGGGPRPEDTSAFVRISPAMPVGGLQTGGLGEGSFVAPLSGVRYTLVANPPDIASVAVESAVVTGTNVGLVRQVIDPLNGTVLSQRTVLEYAVHFDVDLLADTAAAGAAPTIAFFDDAAAQTQVTNAPASARALVIELAGRTPEQDPNFPWVAPVAGAPLGRYRVFTDRLGAARVRTGRLEVSLPNVAYPRM